MTEHSMFLLFLSLEAIHKSTTYSNSLLRSYVAKDYATPPDLERLPFSI